jgi:hypothetical protein
MSTLGERSLFIGKLAVDSVLVVELFGTRPLIHGVFLNLPRAPSVGNRTDTKVEVFGNSVLPSTETAIGVSLSRNTKGAVVEFAIRGEHMRIPIGRSFQLARPLQRLRGVRSDECLVGTGLVVRVEPVFSNGASRCSSRLAHRLGRANDVSSLLNRVLSKGCGASIRCSRCGGSLRSGTRLLRGGARFLGGGSFDCAARFLGRGSFDCAARFLGGGSFDCAARFLAAACFLGTACILGGARFLGGAGEGTFVEFNIVNDNGSAMSELAKLELYSARGMPQQGSVCHGNGLPHEAAHNGRQCKR